MFAGEEEEEKMKEEEENDVHAVEGKKAGNR